MTAILDRLTTRWPDHVIGHQRFRSQDTLLIKCEGLLDVCRFVKTDPEVACDFLMDLSAVDYLKFGRTQASRPMMATPSPLPYYMTSKRVAETWERGVSNDDYRFDVVYHFFSSRHQHRVRLRVPLTSTDPAVPTLTGLWKAANWFEREVWDMFGITFTDHPDLRRILMYEPFEGYPLRKDYPIHKRQPLVGPTGDADNPTPHGAGAPSRTNRQ